MAGHIPPLLPCFSSVHPKVLSKLTRWYQAQDINRKPVGPQFSLLVTMFAQGSSLCWMNTEPSVSGEQV